MPTRIWSMSAPSAVGTADNPLRPGHGQPRAAIGHDEDVDASDRLLPLDGAFNFRNLGGYPGSDGRVTRWGRLFRSDTLHELSPSDVMTLRAMGVATIIDLRTVRELEQTGRGPLEPEPIRYRHLSVIREGGGRDASGEAMA